MAEKRAGTWFVGVGRRKTAVARVFARAGDGKFEINGETPEAFFPLINHRVHFSCVLADAGKEKEVDIRVNVAGGGKTGQAGAVRLGIARALLFLFPATETVLRDKGYLTRDPRMDDRKKYGQAGARRRFQFSKR
ncbi:MAG: 30S ribosomal protein S9 [Planctomycetes bacterium]|nr:30S ribosomal protein S9 [Planctomycetota bacterium]